MGVKAKFVTMTSALDLASGTITVRVRCAIDPISIHDDQLHGGEFVDEDPTFEIPIWPGGGGRGVVVADEARNTVDLACKQTSARLSQQRSQTLPYRRILWRYTYLLAE